MPYLNPKAFKALHKEADWGPGELAAMLGLRPGSLRNAECGRQQMHDRKIFRAARLFSAALKREVAYTDLVAETGDGVPETPPEQPKPKPKPAGRKEKAGKAPKRPQSERGAA